MRRLIVTKQSLILHLTFHKKWCWVRLNSICSKISDGTHLTPKYQDYGIPFLSVKDMSDGKISFKSCKKISEDEHKVLYTRCNPEYKDLLLTKVGSTGIPVIVNTKEKFSLFVSVALIKEIQSIVIPEFLVIYFNSSYGKKMSKEKTRGVGNKNLVLDEIKSFLIPLPSISKQEIICKKINIIEEIIS